MVGHRGVADRAEQDRVVRAHDVERVGRHHRSVLVEVGGAPRQVVPLEVEAERVDRLARFRDDLRPGAVAGDHRDPEAVLSHSSAILGSSRGRTPHRLAAAYEAFSASLSPLCRPHEAITRAQETDMTVTRIIRRAGFLVLLLSIVTSAVAAGRAEATPPPRPDLNPLFAAEWWLRGSLPVTDWVGGRRQSDGVDAIAAWPDTSGEGVVVAVVDSGVDLKTPALDGRLPPGYDFITKGELKGDSIGHGTHVSTIIAGKPQNGDGIFGVAPDARILPLRVGNDYGHVIDGAAAGALAYALRDSQVRVINMSWGKLYSLVVAKALAAAGRDPSVLMVSAAGNDATEMLSSRLLPQSFDSDNEITVASTNYFDSSPFFSNFGTHVEVAAPGERDPLRLPRRPAATSPTAPRWRRRWSAAWRRCCSRATRKRRPRR